MIIKSNVSVQESQVDLGTLVRTVLLAGGKLKRPHDAARIALSVASKPSRMAHEMFDRKAPDEGSIKSVRALVRIRELTGQYLCLLPGMTKCTCQILHVSRARAVNPCQCRNEIIRAS